MKTLTLEILAVWSAVSLVIGLVLGAMIRKGERIHADEFLSNVLSTLETKQASRSLNIRVA